MSLTTNQVAALVEVARAERPPGATTWDAQGIAAFLHRLSDLGLSFGEIHDRVTAHARDRSAKSPGVMMHSKSLTPTEPSVLTPPKRHEACQVCGRRRGICECTAEDRARVANARPTDPATKALVRAKVREAVNAS